MVFRGLLTWGRIDEVLMLPSRVEEMSGMNTGGMENMWTKGTVPDLVSGIASAEQGVPHLRYWDGCLVRSVRWGWE